MIMSTHHAEKLDLSEAGEDSDLHKEATKRSAEEAQVRAGLLIVNADDWGRNRETTDRTLDCVRCGAVSSVSAMAFMEDSERAAEIAQESGIDAGLHLNFTLGFSATHTPQRLLSEQKRISEYLGRYRLSQIVFHPGLRRSFQYVFEAQRDEFIRLYGREPRRYDGHHHMHLCANVLLGGLLPEGTTVRRNFSFQSGEKSWANRGYRQTSDWLLGRHHQLTDMFFSIQPLAQPNHLHQIAMLSREYVVEMETHPYDPDEYAFLTGPKMRSVLHNYTVAARYGRSPEHRS
jgi:predicted glycoside hydrolase/deacetylase ChbG (UPF0249 family)